MEKTRRTIKNSAIFVLFFICLAFPVLVRAYDDDIAHPGIAELAAELYNQKFDPDLTEEEIGWLKKGATQEDTPTRWLNHFYDPVYNRGFSDLGWLGVFDYSFTSAKDWLQAPIIQTDFALGDRSWPRALQDYAKGDREMAFIELGQALHLISDMAVPAHTRDSAHPGDSYETFVKLNWSSIKPALSYDFIEVTNLDQAFDELANYSNHNFYSERTIEVDKYDVLVIKSKEFLGEHNKTYFFSNNNFRVYTANGNYVWRIISGGQTTNDPLVLSDYTTHLVPKAIGYSSGLIKLFLAEAEKAKTEYEEESWWGRHFSDGLPFSRMTNYGLLNQLFGWVISLGEFVWENTDNKFVSAPEFVTPKEQESPQDLELASATPEPTVDSQPDLPQEETLPTDNDSDVNEPTSILDNNEPEPESISPPPQEVLGEIIDESDENEPTPVIQPKLSPSSPGFDLPTPTPSTEPIPEPEPEPEPESEPEPEPEPLPDISAPQLADVFNNIIYTSSSSIDIFGITATNTAYVYGYYRPELAEEEAFALSPETITTSGTSWMGSFSLYTTSSSFKFLAVSDLGVTSTWSNIAQIILDQTPPEVAFVNLSATTTGRKISLTVDYASPDSESVYYDVSYRFDDQDWLDVVTSTTSTQTMVEVDKSGNYFWRVRGCDILGNCSAWLEEMVSAPPIVIDYIYLNGSQEDDERVLTATGSPYILQNYTVPSGKKLIIEPGTVIKAESKSGSSRPVPNPGSRLVVYGELISQGTLSEKIIFTSLKDQTFNDDILNASVLSPASDDIFRDWGGLDLLDGSSTTLHHTEIRYSGISDIMRYIQTRRECSYSQSIFIQNARLDLLSTTFVQAGQAEICSDNSQITGMDLVWDGFEDTPDPRPMTPGYDGIWARGGSLRLDNVSMKNYSRYPIVLDNVEYLSDNITLSDNLFNVPLNVLSLNTNEPGGIFRGEDFYLVAGARLGPTTLESLPDWGLIKKIYIMYPVSCRGGLSLVGTLEDPIEIIMIPEYAGRLSLSSGSFDFDYVNISTREPNLLWFSLIGLGGRMVPSGLYGWVPGQSYEEHLSNNRGSILVYNHELAFIYNNGADVSWYNSDLNMGIIPHWTMLDNEEGRVELNNVSLTWETPNLSWSQNPDWPVIGLYSIRGQLSLTNVEWNNFRYGVYSDGDEEYKYGDERPEPPELFPEILDFTDNIFNNVTYSEFPEGVLFR